MLRSLCVLLLAGLSGLACAVDNHLMDAGFGGDGFVRVDSRLGDSAADAGVGICPGPGDTQIVIGVRNTAAMLTLARLMPDGALDPGYGVQGRVEYAIESPGGELVRNLCLGDGRFDLAYATPAGKIELLRIAGNGLPDPNFGSSGRLSIEPANLPGSTSGYFRFRGMDRGVAGEILLGGELGGSGVGDGRPVLVRVSGNGALRDARVFAASGTHQYGGYVAAAAYGPNGDLWIAGISRQSGNNAWCFTYFGMRLDGATLAGDAAGLGPIGPWSYETGGGRMVRPGVLVLGARLRANQGGVWVPRVLVLREDGASEVSLPLEPGYGEAVGGGLNLVALPGGEQVMYGSSLATSNGIYLARVNIGADAAGDALDTAFGGDGIGLVAYRGTLPSCTGGNVPAQGYARFSLWGALPVFVGSVASSCDQFAGRDILVGRLAADPGDAIFADGFDGA